MVKLVLRKSSSVRPRKAYPDGAPLLLVRRLWGSSRFSAYLRVMESLSAEAKDLCTYASTLRRPAGPG